MTEEGGDGASPPPAAPETGPTVHTRAWLEWHGRNLAGRGRLELLEQIEARGSISAAARTMGVSYRAAWQWIAGMNEAAGRPLVQTSTGGRGGGGAGLTPTGRAVVEAIRLLDARLTEFNLQMTRAVEALFRELSPRKDEDPSAN